MRPVLMLLVATAAFPALAAAPVKFSTTLDPGNEVPGPGARGGSGSAQLTFDPDKGQVCYMLMSKGTDTPTMAHIHNAIDGVDGPVVVSLTAPKNGMSKGCAAVKPDLMKAILANPSQYYVNVHTAAFPRGAMRGQLK